jgi:hypothetical protein
MEKTEIKIWMVSILLVTASCKPSPEQTEKNCWTKAIEQAAVGSQYQWIVVLPGLGCHGCIQEAEVFMQEYITDRRILFVLTKVSSLKILQQRTEIRISEHPNIYIDRDNIFDIPTDNRIYPCVIRLEKGHIIGHSFQSPKKAAFLELEQIIAD